MNYIDRTLPNATKAEEAIIGAMLLDAQESGATCRQELTADHFYAAAHRVTFNAIVASLDKSGDCDLVSLSHRLRESGQLDEIGGEPFLMDCMSRCPSTAMLDNWVALVKAAHLRRQAIEAGTNLVNEAFDLDSDTPPADWITEKAFALSQLGESRRAPTQPANAITQTVSASLLARWESRDGITGEPTGLTDLDAIMRGMRPGQLITIAGHRSDGKTALACNIGATLARLKKRVLFFSLEMTREEIVERMVALHAGIDLSRFNQHLAPITVCGQAERALHEIETWPLLVNDRAGQSAPAIAAEARRQSARHPLDLIVVDFLQLIAWPSRAETGAVAIGENARMMKAVAKDCGCPLLLLSQLNRADLAGGQRPQLHNLRGSGEIEEAADAVLLLSGHLTAEELPDAYQNLSQREIDQLLQVDIAKHRNGATGLTYLRFDRPTQRFQNFAKPSQCQQEAAS